MHRLAGRGEPVAHSSTPGEYSWCPSPSGGWSRRKEEGIYGEEGSYRVVSISSVIDNANTALWCAWYVVRARDALETAGAPRPRASARDSKPREGRKVKSDEERLASERKRKKKKEKEREGEREREWYGSWQCQCLRRCTEALSERAGDWVSSGCTGRMDSCRGYVELVAVCGDYLNEPPLISKLFSPGVSLSLSLPSSRSLPSSCRGNVNAVSAIRAFPRRDPSSSRLWKHVCWTCSCANVGSYWIRISRVS